MANKEGFVIRNKMADALHKCVVDASGMKLDRVGKMVVHRVLTNEARGVGVKFRERLTLKKKETADSAGNVGVMA